MWIYYVQIEIIIDMGGPFICWTLYPSRQMWVVPLPEQADFEYRPSRQMYSTQPDGD